MEKYVVTSTDEGKASEKQHQVNVDLFLWSEGPLEYVFRCVRKIAKNNY